MPERDPEEKLKRGADELEQRIDKLGEHIDEAGKKAADADPGGFDDPEAEEEDED